LKAGQNTIEIDVTNLPFNRIRDYDARGVNWRIFKDINIVNISYRENVSYASWEVHPAGLIHPVSIIPLTKLAL